jgi:hypothetical protein
MIAVYDAGILVYGEEGTLDCNDNGIDDADEIAGGTSDLDGNGRPDECDADCNGDGVPDAYDIATGAEDCDGNGIPDGCESFADCDGDGLDDACAISAGLVADCDGNGIPDGCDIDAGSEDLDGDGVLDTCQLNGLLGSFTILDDWGSGFTAELVVTNYGEESIRADWAMEFQSSFEVDNIWPAEYQVDAGGTVTVFAPDWSQPVASGDSIVVGIQGSYSGGFAGPSEVVLNGSAVQLD